MNASRLRKATAAAVMLASLSACSLFQLPSDVRVQAVPVDLTFGVELEQDSTDPTLPAFDEIPEIDLPDLPSDRKPIFDPRPKVDPCPPPTALGPKKETPDTITHEEYLADENSPTRRYKPERGENFLFREVIDWDDDGKPQFQRDGIHFINSVFPATNGDGWKVVVLDRISGKKMWIQVIAQRPDGEDVPQPDPDRRADQPVLEPGVYLAAFELPAADKPDEEGYLYRFDPQPALLLGSLPWREGEQNVTAAADAQNKGDSLPRVGEVVPSDNKIRLTSVVGSKEIIEVCTELAQAVRVNFSLRSEGSFTFDIVGSMWIDLNYGGMPIREDYVIFGSRVRSGTISSNLMRLDPVSLI